MFTSRAVGENARGRVGKAELWLLLDEPLSVWVGACCVQGMWSQTGERDVPTYEGPGGVGQPGEVVEGAQWDCCGQLGPRPGSLGCH